MADYGVGGDDWSPLPWAWAAERLAPTRNYWVVTVSGDGRPAAMPLWGVWDEGVSRFMFSGSPNSRKARNIAANPNVVVMLDDTVECVSVEGVARVIEPGEAGREEWIEAYMAKYGPLEPELNAEFIRDHLMVEVTPTRAFAVIERADEFATRATRWVFD